ncbi:MAG TPA: phage holin family protein [Verrucomicrobiae bacterium]|nr:phage holin family protein [Verrucomicrobiae bacterium]
MANTPDDSPPGVIASAAKLLRTVAAIVQNRAELLALELQEEGMKLAGLLLLVGLVIGFGLLSLIMLTFTILFAVGEEHRLAAAIIMTLLYLGVTGAAVWYLQARLKNWTAFPATRAELRKDREWLEEKHSES